MTDPRDLPGAGATLHALVLDRARQDPGRTAVTFGGERWSYGDLDRRSAAVARRLHALGIAPGEPVGLAVDRSFEMVTGLLGALRAGGAYVPLDPGYPAERLAFMWGDCGARVLLTREGLAGELPGALTDGASVIDLDRVADGTGDGETDAPALGPDDLAYVIYTSGSTGRPKGVMVEHRGAVRVVRENVRLLGVTPESRVLQLASLSFDASVLEIFTALATGAELALTPRETLLSGEALGEELRARRITTLAIPPSLLDKVPEGVELPELESIVVGGETCPAATAERWAPGRRFYNAYAPTEATIYITAHRCQPPFDGAASRPHWPPIGRPIAGGVVRVLGPDLRPVAADESGELCLGGVGLTRGYLGRPALTAERFVPDPEATEEAPGARLYRSGDLGRRLPDGALVFHGRADHQVKVRGVRIELGEIEAVLAEHPDVRSAVVDLRSGEGGGGDEDRLIAYLVPRDGAAPTAEALRRFLAARLPEAMLPQAFVTLDALPMAPTGKVDRRSLPDPGTDRPDLDAGYQAPRGATETALAAIWGELLGLDRVGRHDDLFALGGHSLVVTRIAGRVREDLGREVPLLVIFEHPTVAGLAAWLEAPEEVAGEAVEGVEPDELPPIRPVPRDGRPLPVSFPQERVWFLIQLAPHAIAYNFQFSIRFRGGLEIERLRRALTGVVERHEVLRTTFPAVDGRPVQEIHPPYEVELPRIDLTALPAERRQPEAECWVRREIRRGFDVLTLPLFRTRVFELAADDHLFLQVEHHFIHDGWSLAVYLRDLQALYRGETLPPLPVQYADFAVWQREWMDGPAFERQLAYWRRALSPGESGELPVLALPTDRPRPHAHEFRGGALRVDMPGELYAGIRRFGREQGMTLFMTMLSAFYTLMHRYTGQEDVLLGSGLANRRLRETEELVGMVVNTVVLRERPEAEISFRQLLERVRTTTLEAHLHQDTPFERLVQELQPERDLSGNPIFQVLFSFHDAAVPDLEMPELGLSGDLWEWHNGSAKSDLNVVVKPMAEQRVGRQATGDELLTMVWEYSAAILDRTTVERMWGHYQVILRGAIEDPSRALAALPLLTEAERTQIRGWSDTPPPAPLREGAETGAEPVHRLIARRVRERPGAPAVVTADGTLSYGELAARAGALARRLARLSQWHGPETVVAVLTGRSPETAVAALAVTAAGGAYLPVDPDYPAERIAHLLEDSGAAAVVARHDLRHLLPGDRLPVLLPGDGEGDGEEGEEDRAAGGDGLPDRVDPDELPGRHPERLAYVIYTSGSTGRPKGVELTHRGLDNLVAWHLERYLTGPAGALRGDERATLLAGPGFDAAVWELWPALAAGAALHVPPEALRSDPERLLGWLAAEGITVSFLPTPLAEAVLDTIRVRGVPEGLRLRSLLTGGDRLHRPPPEGLPFEVVNHYGPTESTVVATAGAVTAGARTPPPIGSPIGGLGARVLDRTGRRVPVGVPGELCVAGRGLARGYRGRPSWTAEAFGPDPIPPQTPPSHPPRPAGLGVDRGQGTPPPDVLQNVAGARIYRTGDLARWLPDGRLEFLGRIDSQIQIRGFRVELGEIESVLTDHPDLGEAVVVAWSPDAPEAGGAETRLVAYVVPAADREPPGADDLEAWAARRLPDYMVPWRFVAIAELPLTPHGKVDRPALPEPEGVAPGAAAGTSRIAPRTPAEKVVAGIWAGVLGIDEPGVHDDFFRLGGHSLLATRVLSRLRDTTGVDVPLAALFDTPTVAGLAARVEGTGLGARAGDEEKIAPVDRDSPVPLSFTQERLWFLDRLTQGTAAYVIGRGYRIDGLLDAAALAGALGDVVARHEALRTRFVTADAGEDDDEAPVQVVDPPAPVPMPVIDLSGLAGVGRERADDEAQRLAVEHAARPFDLAAGPLLRSALVRVGADEETPGRGGAHRWLVAMHHIASDGWSMEIFHREIGARYGARVAAPAPTDLGLPELAVQYPDFAVWQRRRLRGETLERLLDYWRDHLAGAPGYLDLPLDRPRPPLQRFRGAEAVATVPAQTAAALDRLAREAGATRFMALLAAFAALLARYAHAAPGESGAAAGADVVVGAPVAGRTRSETEPLIGFFVNTLALRMALAPGAGFRDLLAVARRATVDGHAHQELPFEKLVEELQPERDLSHSPLFQVLLGVEERSLRAPELAGAETTVMPVERHEARFDLELSVTEAAAGDFVLRLRYDCDLFEPATAGRMAGHLRALVEEVVARPDAGWRTLPLLSPVEREELLREGYGPQLDRGETGETGLHQAFERQAGRTPEAEALVWNEERVSYRELAERARRLAGHLAARGIGPENRVGVFLERTPELIVSLLAVLRTGAAYVPLDPDYPRARLELILDDSAAPVVLTTEALAGRLPVPSDRLLRLDAEAEAIAARSADPAEGPTGSVDPEGLAYVIYTSGSTGRPKGVGIPHRAARALVTWGRGAFRPEELASVLATTSVCFDLSVFEIFLTLATGGRMILADSLLALPELPHVRSGGRVTLINTVPSAMAELVAAEALPPGVLTVNLAGEPLRRDLADRLYELGVERVHDLYGPSEDTTYSTVARRLPGGPETIGRPVAGTRAFLVDARLEPVPPGAAGEIVLGGAGLARGYLERPRTTAERFVPDPLTGSGGPGGEPGARLYRTGDLARRLPEPARGELRFLGRIDHQVKLRGFRIELGEIEAALTALPEVREAVVTTKGTSAGAEDRYLAAYVVGAPGADRDPEPGELRQALERTLPGYMVPGGFAVLDELPRLPNGKVDRSRLAEIETDIDAGSSGDEPVAPATDTEKSVAEIWSEVLGRERIGTREDFFHIGGHSLLAIRVIARIRRRLGAELPLRALFQHPTIQALAAAVDAALEEADGPQVPAKPAIRKVERRRRSRSDVG